MGQLALIATVAQTIGTVFSTIGQARQQQAEAENYAFQQRQLEGQQKDAQIAANQEDTTRRRELSETLSTIDAIRASRGFTKNSPTGDAIVRDIRETASADIRTSRLNNLFQADALRQQSNYAGEMASFSRSSAKSTMLGGFANAGISLLGGQSGAKLFGGPSKTLLSNGQTVRWTTNRYGVKY